MKKKDILKLKSMALSIMLASSAIMLSGCEKSNDDNSKGKKHYHLITTINDQKYIFRECIDGIDLYASSESGLMYVHTHDGKMIVFNGIYYDTNNEFMIEQEKVALKDGAIVYGNSTDDYSLCLK